MSVFDRPKHPTNYENYKKCNALCKALHTGCADSIRKTIADKKVYNINDEDPCGYFPLHFAIRSGCDTEVLKLLIDAGADINLKNSDGNTPLHTAFAVNSHEIAELLITFGAHLNIKNRVGNTAMHVGMRHCSLDMAKSMFDAGADVNSKTSNGKTLLHFAAVGINNAVVKYLISRGVDVNAKDDYGQTALHYVAESGAFGRGPMLPHGYCYSGMSPLDSRLNTMEILLMNGADADALNNQGETPLYVLAKDSYDNVMKLIVKHTAKLNENNNQEKVVIANDNDAETKQEENFEWEMEIEKKMKDLRKENKDLKMKFIDLKEKVKKIMKDDTSSTESED